MPLSEQPPPHHHDRFSPEGVPRFCLFTHRWDYKKAKDRKMHVHQEARVAIRLTSFVEETKNSLNSGVAMTRFLSDSGNWSALHIAAHCSSRGPVSWPGMQSNGGSRKAGRRSSCPAQSHHPTHKTAPAGHMWFAREGAHARDLRNVFGAASFWVSAAVGVPPTSAADSRGLVTLRVRAFFSVLPA